MNGTGNVTIAQNISAANLSISSSSGSVIQSQGAGMTVTAGPAQLEALGSIQLDNSGINNFGTSGLVLGNELTPADISIIEPITITGPIKVFGRNVTLNESLTANAGYDIVISAVDYFTNNEGPTALNVSDGGRWIVYAGTARTTDWSGFGGVAGLGNTYGNLVSGNQAIWGEDYASMKPEQVAAGNRYVFKQDPIRTVLVTTTDNFKTYGDVINVGSNVLITSTGTPNGVNDVYFGSTDIQTHSVAGIFDASLPVFTSTKSVASAEVGTAAIVATTLGTMTGRTQANQADRISFGNQEKYDVTYVNDGVLTVNRRPITLTANAATKVYDGTENTVPLTVSISGGSLAVGVDTLAQVTGDIARQAGADVGAYDIRLGTGSRASNYDITFEQDNNAFTITKAPLTLTGTKVYDGTLDFVPSLATSIVITGVNGEIFTATGTATKVTRNVQVEEELSDVSGLTLIGVNGSKPSNYFDLTPAQTKVTVEQRAVTLIAPNARKIYDANIFYDVTEDDLNNLSALLGGVGDRVREAEVEFDTKDAGSGKTVEIKRYVIDDGNNGNNYDIELAESDAGFIGQAPLTITAVDDAEFVTQVGGRTNFAGVVYSGFVGGEDEISLSAQNVNEFIVGRVIRLSEAQANLQDVPITPEPAETNLRINEVNDGFSVYRNVLRPVDFTATNYAITIEKGDYTIVAADTLLVRAQLNQPQHTDMKVEYGALPSYSIVAEYLDNVSIDNDGQVISGTIISSSDSSHNFNIEVNAITPTDELGDVTIEQGNSSATFKLDPENAQLLASEGSLLSSSGLLKASGYILRPLDTSITGANFKNVVLIGALTVKPKEIDVDNLGIDRIHKTYDGSSRIAGLDLNYNKQTADVRIADDLFIVGAGNFQTPDTHVNDQHVGVGKRVNINLALRGDDAGNYKLITIDEDGNKLSGNEYINNVGEIEVLDSVQWVGLNDGVWSNPNNWAGGALPDRNNVLNILIPNGRTTVYDSVQFGVTSSAINNQGTIRFVASEDFDFANDVSGIGSIQQRGTGELTLSGNNTFTGELDIGSGVIKLGSNTALGQASVRSNSGSLGLTSGIVLPSLTVDGPITMSSAINTLGDQTYNGALTFSSSGTVSPQDIGDDPRVANFESTQGNIVFAGTVNGAGNQLVVSAAQQIRFDDEVGESFVGSLANNFEIAQWQSYGQTKANLNPTGVDVLATDIFINANIATKGPQLYTGATRIGSNGDNGTNRILLSMNPSITFVGTVDDSAVDTHTLILRAIDISETPDDSIRPTISHGNVGGITRLAGFDAQVGSQDFSGRVASIQPNPVNHKGEITIGGSVNTLGDIIYKAGDVTLDAESGVILRTEGGSVSIETKVEAGVSKPINIPAGQSLGVSIGYRGGSFVNNTGTPAGSIAFRRDPPLVTAEQTGSGMVAAFQRSIARIQTRQMDIDEMLDLSGMGVSGGEVSIGALQDASNTSITDAEATSSGATQIDCSNEVVAQANEEQCRSTNQD